MKHDQSLILNKKIILIPENCEFGFVEDLDYISEHPLQDYYMKLSDISLNIHISLKWSSFCFFFLENISFYIDKDYLKNYIERDFIFEEKYTKHRIFLDDFEINNYENFLKIINSEYVNDIYTENTKVRWKIQINVSDFLLLQNTHFPSLWFI